VCHARCAMPAADLVDWGAVEIGVPDPDRPGGWPTELGRNLEVPVILRPAAVDIGEVSALHGTA
jgi:hypothetical protein